MTLFLPLTALRVDAPTPWAFGFQDGASVAFEGISELHSSVMFYVVAIVVGVFYMLSAITVRFSDSPSSAKYLTHGTALELVWTVSPALLLVAVAFPSFRLLYLMDEVVSPSLTVKVLGHQWFWSYEYSDQTADGEGISFDSYLQPTGDLEEGGLRLLAVDEQVVVPTGAHVRFVLSSTDVIHSWAVPSLGVKLDAIPGRLNQTSTLAERDGVYFGQCSELCGVYHGFMPIAVRAVPVGEYLSWLLSQ
jgi:cytochrome c oxidase subunit 2